MVNVKVKAMVNLSELLKKEYIIDTTIDYEGEIFILTQVKKISSNEEQYNRDNTKDYYKVYALKQDKVIYILSLVNMNIDFHYLRKIDDTRYLISSARCWYHSEDNIEKNTMIINGNGEVLERLTLGDGIEDIKIEDKKTIWTSYFDEGIFGNNGWENPIGACGLRSWELDGKTIYKYNPSNYDYLISDCYAMNIDSDNNKWFYFYTDFYLGRIDKNDIKYYSIGIEGANTLVVNNEYVLMDKGYGERNTFVLLKVLQDELKLEKEIKFVDYDTGNDIKIIKTQFFSDKLLIQTINNIYSISLSEV